MKSFLVCFAYCCAFSLVADAIYWFVAKVEPAGVAFFSVMTLAFAWIVAYAVVAERNARLLADDPKARHEDARGELVGIFTTKTPLPVLVALCVAFLLFGVVWSPAIAILALAGVLVVFWFLGRESANVGRR